MSETIKVPVQCVMCNKKDEIEVPKAGYEQWRGREKLIQYAMPKLSPGQREFLISQTCPECFDRMWKEMPEDEDGDEG